MTISRFLPASLVLAAAALAAEAPQWYRGQLQAHSFWSDGRVFPEEAVAFYKSRGYHFLSLTEHNRFADDPAQWRKLISDASTEARDAGMKRPPQRSFQITRHVFNAYAKAFGKEAVETKFKQGGTHVRLKTYAEVKTQFEEPGKFILLPGVELSQDLGSSTISMSYLNLPLSLPSLKDAGMIKEIDAKTSVGELLAANAAEVDRVAAELKTPYLLTLNYPFFSQCRNARFEGCQGILPQDLIDCPAILFLEIRVTDSIDFPNPRHSIYHPEPYWDVVNAFRLLAGRPLLYGVGSDDAHFYERPDDRGKPLEDRVWVMVRARALTPEDLFGAMRRGDFYVSCGVLLEDVSFSPEDRTLRVKVQAEPGATYRIVFIATKRDFDQTVTKQNPGFLDTPWPDYPRYSDTIGRTVKTVEGPAGEYQLTEEDLYVRARVESNRPGPGPSPDLPSVKTAWTQPYAVGVSAAIGMPAESTPPTDHRGMAP